MTRRIVLALALGLVLASPALAIVDKVRACDRDFSPGSKVPLVIGRKNTIKVFGGFVDTSNKVEDSGLPGVSARITERSGGIGSNVTIEITIADSARDGDEGEIRLRYPVEVAGFDKFKVKLFAPAKIASVTPENVDKDGGSFLLLVGREVTFAIRGSNLDRLTPGGSWDSKGNARMISASGTEARMRFMPERVTQFDVKKGFFKSDPDFCSATVEGDFEVGIKIRSGSSGGSGGGTAPPPPAAGGGGGGTAPGPTRTPAPTRTTAPPPPPDLVPTKAGSLLRPGPNRQIDSSFCTNLPTPPRADQAATGTVTVPPFRWGVINSSNSAVNTAFSVRLESGTGQAIATETVTSLSAGGQQLFEMRRPQSQTKVIRIDAVTNATTKAQYGGASANGCFQLIMEASDPLNWKDPSPLKIKVDTGNSVAEGAGGEINNEISF